jgi:iron complex transport system substrate-binding protein
LRAVNSILKLDTGALRAGIRYAKFIGFLCVLLSASLVMLPNVQAAPKVASINVCTDQLAILLADKEQISSVSYLSLDPKVSYLAEEAADYPHNYGRAEEIFMQKPDIILAGSFTSRATIDLLKRLGFQVEEFSPAASFTDIRNNIKRMGILLDQASKADALIAQMDDTLSRIQPNNKEHSIALYYANNYTSGEGSLMDSVVRKAGFTNIADQLNLQGYGQLPLEILLMHQPDYLLLGEQYLGAALAYQNYEHPALQALQKNAVTLSIPDNLTVCGGPFTAEAVKILSDLVHE